jgi:hypothetical protein
MKKLAILCSTALALGVAGCGGGNTINTVSCEPKLFNPANPVQPACTIPVNFTVDDSVNQVFANAEMQWKGSFQYDAATRVAYYDGTWNGGNGPFAPLYDDGPWTAGGHEPIGSTAGDHKLGATIFVHPHAAVEHWEYGLVDHAFGDGWIWIGANGKFDVNPGATQPIPATGQTMPAFGTVDLKLTIDTNNLAAGTWTGRPVQVKGSAWGWVDIPIVDDGTLGDDVAGDGIYTFVLSQYAGAGKQLYHTGLTKTGDVAQFVFAFGAGHLGSATYKEYKVVACGTPPANCASSTGVLAFTGPAGGPWTATTVSNQTTGDLNTIVTIP